MPRSSRPLLPTLAALLACTGALPAAALPEGRDTPSPVPEAVLPAQLIEDDGSAERINYAGKLRMLSQRIPAAACNAAAGIAPEVSGPMLAEAAAEFDRIIDALRDGDAALGIIGAETDRKVLADIEAVHAVWNPLHLEIDDMIAGSIAPEDVAGVVERSVQLLQVSKHLASVEMAEHSDPTALLQADAMTIDIAGRQRMLAQRISKNACLIAEGIEPGAARTEMKVAMETYEVSLTALRHGMPAAGITPPRTEEIAAGLDGVIDSWAAMQPGLAHLLDGTEIDVDARTAIFGGMNTLTGGMNVLVPLYTEASKLGL